MNGMECGDVSNVSIAAGAAGEGDWFSRLAAWLLWLKQHAPEAGPWRRYIALLPQASRASGGWPCCCGGGASGERIKLSSLPAAILLSTPPPACCLLCCCRRRAR